MIIKIVEKGPLTDDLYKDPKEKWFCVVWCLKLDILLAFQGLLVVLQTMLELEADAAKLFGH